MKKIAIIYHSGFGHTKIQAEYILKGVNKVPNTESKIYNIEEAISNLANLNIYDAMIFGSPTYMGSVSASFKEFMEKSSTIWLERQWSDKIAAGFTSSHSLSGDKLNSLMQLNIFAMQHGMIWVGQDELNQSPEDSAGKTNAINRVGSFLGAMAQTESTLEISKGDLITAEKLGIRVAKITQKLS